jgi:hypothetical protein
VTLHVSLAFKFVYVRYKFIYSWTDNCTTHCKGTRNYFSCTSLNILLIEECFDIKVLDLKNIYILYHTPISHKISHSWEIWWSSICVLCKLRVVLDFRIYGSKLNSSHNLQCRVSIPKLVKISGVVSEKRDKNTTFPLWVHFIHLMQRANTSFLAIASKGKRIVYNTIYYCFRTFYKTNVTDVYDLHEVHACVTTNFTAFSHLAQRFHDNNVQVLHQDGTPWPAPALLPAPGACAIALSITFTYTCILK